MKITIGRADSKPVALDLDVLISTRLLIQANSGAGKSYLLRRLMEELYGHIQVIAIDPEGEFSTLREKYGYVLVGKGGETPADVRSAGTVAEKLLEIRASAVCDLYEMKPGDRHRWVQTFLEALTNAPKELWHPAIIIVDEAHLFCPEKGAGESQAKEAMIDLTSRGRKRGFCAVWATQRLAKVDKDATSMLQNRLVGGTFEDVDIKRALDLLSVAPEHKREVAQQLKVLDPGWFYAFGRALSKERLLFKVDQVDTSHPKPGSAKHAAAPPPAPEQVEALLPQLADLPKLAEARARTVEDLQAKIRSLTAELSAVKREKPAAPQIDEKMIRDAVEQAAAQVQKQRDEHWLAALRDYQAGVSRRINEAAGMMVKAVETYPFTQPTIPKAKISNERVQAANPRKEVRGTEIATRGAARPSAVPHPENNGDLSPSRLRILAALAQFEAIGRTPVPKKWIAALAGVSHQSSGYTNNLGALRTRGYIDYPVPGAAALTEDGRHKAPAIDAPRDPQEILEYCRGIVTTPQYDILAALFNAYPNAIEKRELAERVGVSSNSSGYTNNLGALRSAGMIDYPEPGKARAASWLFLE